MARWLTLKQGATVRFDATAFERDPLREFALDPYGLENERATPEEIARFSVK